MFIAIDELSELTKEQMEALIEMTDRKINPPMVILHKVREGEVFMKIAKQPFFGSLYNMAVPQWKFFNN